MRVESCLILLRQAFIPLHDETDSPVIAILNSMTGRAEDLGEPAKTHGLCRVKLNPLIERTTMDLKNIPVCKDHGEMRDRCLLCDLTSNENWKEKYFETAEQLVDVVEELFHLESNLKETESLSSK